MESLGNILKGRKIPTAISKESTDTSSSDRSLSSEDNRSDEDECPRCKGARVVYPRLPSGGPDYSRVVPCYCVRHDVEDNRLSRLEQYSNLGLLTRLTFDNLVKEGRSSDAVNQESFLRAYHAAMAFSQSPQGWLVFMGPSGCGKTHLAAAIANHRIQQGELALFVGVSDLLDHLRSTYNPESDISYDQFFEQVKNAPLLILDDLGTQSSTPWAEEKLSQIIDYRYNGQIPTVVNIAAGLSLESFAERWYTRLTSASLSQVHLLEDRKDHLLDYTGLLSLELLSSMTFETFDSKRSNLDMEKRQNLEHAFRLARNFADSPDGWIIYQGENGCGKTHLAAAIANYRIRNGKPVTFVVVPDFLDHLRSTFSPESKTTYDDVFEKVKTAPLLILDDFGEHSTTGWAQEKLYQLINYRYNARLPMVVTMCCTLDDDGVESRVSSRLADPKVSLVFNITAPDYRTDRAIVSKDTTPPPRPRGRRRTQ